MYNSPLKKSFGPAHHSGRRDMAGVRVIVMHSTEGETAAGAASWFANPASQGSAHICVDGKEGYRTLSDVLTPWANGWNKTLDMEHAGYARWARARWLSPSGIRMLRRSAYRTAIWCKKYDIPPVWLSPVELRAGRAGLTTHIDVSKAFHQSDHSDPGLGFPKRRYRRLVNRYLKEMRG